MWAMKQARHGNIAPSVPAALRCLGRRGSRQSWRAHTALMLISAATAHAWLTRASVLTACAGHAARSASSSSSIPLLRTRSTTTHRSIGASKPADCLGGMCVRSGLGLLSVSEGLSAQTSVRTRPLYGTYTRAGQGGCESRAQSQPLGCE